jgi:hypothetical protein
MKRIAFLIALVASAMAVAACVGVTSAKAVVDPVPGWLASTCTDESGTTFLSDDAIEEDLFGGAENDCLDEAAEFGFDVICVDGKTYKYVTDDGDILAADFVSEVNNAGTGHSAHVGACAATAPPRPADRYGYCSAPGDTYPDGTPIAAGTFLNLLLGQPDTDKHYTGAVPAYYVQGEGITCSLTPSQAALAAASTDKAGGGGDVNQYAFYTYVANA